jgi:hypothetical protein
MRRCEGRLLGTCLKCGQHQSRPEEEPPKPKQTIINHETERCFDPAMGHHQGDGNSLQHACPVVYLCLDLLKRRVGITKTPTNRSRGLTRPDTRHFFTRFVSFGLVFFIEVIFPNLAVFFDKVCFLGTCLLRGDFPNLGTCLLRGDFPNLGFFDKVCSL